MARRLLGAAVAILRRYPGRSAWMWGPVDEGGELRLVPYEEGMRVRWQTLP